MSSLNKRHSKHYFWYEAKWIIEIKTKKAYSDIAKKEKYFFIDQDSQLRWCNFRLT